jgi:hypothetical protein
VVISLDFLLVLVLVALAFVDQLPLMLVALSPVEDTQVLHRTARSVGHQDLYQTSLADPFPEVLIFQMDQLHKYLHSLSDQANQCQVLVHAVPVSRVHQDHLEDQDAMDQLVVEAPTGHLANQANLEIH